MRAYLGAQQTVRAFSKFKAGSAMASERSTVENPPKLVLRRDFGAVRDLLRRIKASTRCTDLCLFSRRSPGQLIDYLDRRGCIRSRVEMPVYVAPIEFDGHNVERFGSIQEEILAFTRDVSRRGVGFTHDEPFCGDYAIVTFDLLDGRPASLALEVRWSNIESGSAYMTGGRFFGIAEPAEC